MFLSFRTRRAYRGMVLNRMREALYPLPDKAVKKMFTGVSRLSCMLRNGISSGASPEATAVLLLTHVMPDEFGSITSDETRASMVTALEEAAAGPHGSMAEIVSAPSDDPLVTLARNLPSRLWSWEVMGLIDSSSAEFLLDELQGVLRGTPREERIAARLDRVFLDAVLDPDTGHRLEWPDRHNG